MKYLTIFLPFNYISAISPKKWLFVLLMLLVGCSTTEPVNDITQGYSSDINERAKNVALLRSWQVKGKIAFITSEERQSASLFWSKSSNNQQLNLTTYLGINVLKLISTEGEHTIEVDGKTYKSDNLDHLIESLIDIRFPADALTHWIKGIAYNQNDSVTFNEVSKLPSSLTSYYNSHQWQIEYLSYQTLIKNSLTIALPNKIKITSEDLTIHIAINNWTI